MNTFFLIAKTEANWNEFLIKMRTVVGKSITTDLDSRGVDVGDTNSLMCLLGDEHVFYTLGIVILKDVCFGLLQERHNLTIKVKETQSGSHCLAITSGSLKEWKEAIESLRKSNDLFTKELGKNLFNWFNIEENLWGLFKVLAKE